MMDRSQAASVHDASPPSVSDAAGSAGAKGLQQTLHEELLADEKQPRQPAAQSRTHRSSGSRPYCGGA